MQLAYFETKVKKDEFDEAQNILTNNLVLFPNDKETLRVKANYYERVKKYKKVKKMLQQIVVA